jgi:hypothetical protein
VVVGVTDEDVDKVRPWVKEHEPKYPIVIEESAHSAHAFKVEGIPHAFLIDPEGKLAWEGHPAQLTEQTIERVLADAVPVFAKLAGDLEPVQALLDRQQPGKAMALLASLEQGGKLDATAAKLAVLTQKRLERESGALLDEAKKLREQKKVCDMAVVLHQLSARFDGGPPAEEARQILKEMSRNSTTKREIEAALPLARGRTLEAQKKYDEAYAQYILATQYGHSEADAKAQLAIDAIVHRGLRGYRADCPDCQQAGKACKKHLKK